MSLISYQYVDLIFDMLEKVFSKIINWLAWEWERQKSNLIFFRTETLHTPDVCQYIYMPFRSRIRALSFNNNSDLCVLMWIEVCMCIRIRTNEWDAMKVTLEKVRQACELTDLIKSK